jgi:GNAT superfamily N-acetyltransferase
LFEPKKVILIEQSKPLPLQKMRSLIRAAGSDALALTTLARDIYKDHYLHLWHPGGADWYMEEYAYSLAGMEKDLEDPNVEYYISVEDGAYTGYLKLVLSSFLEGEEALEVERIYLYKNALGKGLGRQFMELAIQRAGELDRKTIYLKAMDSSDAAIAFYRKMGFEICGTLQLPLPDFLRMKKEFRGMVIMKRNIDVHE